MESNVFKRKIESELEEWLTKGSHDSALLIEGARRVGKTTVCEKFAKKHFRHYLIIDFSTVNEDVIDLFEAKDDLDRFFEKLFLYLNSPILERGSLIVFDEIQFCVRAREKIKSLVKDGRYRYIETGSLISIRENSVSIQIPSEEYPISMHPMDYEEFLWALGKDSEADFIRKCYKDRALLDKPTHERLMETFRLYAAIGGMPAVVSAYVRSRDFCDVERKKTEILALYNNDLRKIDAKYGTNTKRAFDLLPAIAAKQTYTMPLSLFGIDPRTTAFSNNLEKLDETKVFRWVPLTHAIEAALSAGIKQEQFKLYLLDVGLAISQVFAVSVTEARPFYKKFLLGEMRSNLGYIAECLVAEMLSQSGKKLFYASWSEPAVGKDGHEYPLYYEVDFLYARHGKAQPVEVKSGKWKAIASSARLRRKHPDTTRIPIVFSPNLPKEGEGYIEIPFYMAFCL